jgi:small-conductance mechanosensitive channel
MNYYKILDEIQSAILSLLIGIGVFTVPFMPAMFLGYAVFNFYKNELGLTFGIISAIVLEIVGIVIAEIGLETIDAWQENLIKGWKATLMMMFMPIVAIIIACVVYFSEDAFPPVIKGLAIAGAFLATMVYVSIAIHRGNIRVRKQKELEKAERKAERLSRKSTGISSGKMETEFHSFQIEPLENIMEKYEVKKSRAYEIRQLQKEGKWNGHNS